MRMKKASVNVFINFITVIIGFFPAFVLRKYFLNTFGNDMLGLVSLFTNIIGLLSIAELGIGSAIIYSMYKPFAEQNKEKIKGYLQYYARFYRNVGGVIFAAGLATLPFLHLFIDRQIHLADAQRYFLLFLADTLISYFFSYKLCMLIVAQDEYKVALATVLSKVSICALQLLVIHLFPNFYVFILAQIFVNLVYFVSMNAYINKRYSWLRNAQGRIDQEEKSSLIRNIRALFMHKIGGTIVFGIDNMMISAFINLTTVGIFNSYYMVIGAAQTIISKALSGVTASIGNMLTEGNASTAYRVHRRLFFISFWIVSVVAIGIFNTIEPFIHLWLGPGQTLDRLTICIVMLNFYFTLMRGSVERFKEGAGIYHQDRYAPLFEAAINLAASVLLVRWIGLPGIFLGTLISNLSVIFWLKPKLVYNLVFRKPLLDYFRLYFTYLFIASIPLAASAFATYRLQAATGFGAFALNVIVNLLIVNLSHFIFLRKTEEYTYFKDLIVRIVQNKLLPKVRKQRLAEREY
ncbi:oligosaccharide flippase family protein [Paenibacillus sp.]|uniref:lipopolysaccharide biosynthesis protein n=1 Tax=Paenibacillus sp. TaxID=58172 RepID=UPI002811A72A|nr:oligosaccharide flippase family protein [Paenibacillus sp.]